jgi:ABC-type sugar transport system ATPase subunit
MAIAPALVYCAPVILVDELLFNRDAELRVDARVPAGADCAP